MTYRFQKLFKSVSDICPGNFCPGFGELLGICPGFGELFGKGLKWIYTFSELEEEPSILIKTKIAGVTFKSNPTMTTRSSIISHFIDDRWEIYKNYLSEISEKEDLLSMTMNFVNFNCLRYESDLICTATEDYIKIACEKNNFFDENARRVFVKVLSGRVFLWEEVGYLPADLSVLIAYIYQNYNTNSKSYVFIWKPLSKRNLELFIIIYFSNLSKEREKKEKKNRIDFMTLRDLRKKMEVR